MTVGALAVAGILRALEGWNVPVAILRLQPCLRFESSFPHGLILRMLFLPARGQL